MIQPGNWRGHVMQVIQHEKNCGCTGLVPSKIYRYRDRYQPKFHRDLNRNSGRVLVGEDREGICRGEKESSRGGELNGR